MKSQFQACVCHFEMATGPLELNWLDDWPFYAPFRLGSIVCRDSRRLECFSSTRPFLAVFDQRFHFKGQCFDESLFFVWQILIRLVETFLTNTYELWSLTFDLLFFCFILSTLELLVIQSENVFIYARKSYIFIYVLYVLKMVPLNIEAY